MEKVATILNNYGQLGVQLLKASVARLSATGETEKSIRYEVISKEENDRLKIIARKFFETIETGRGPRKSTQEGGFRGNLEKYLEARGFERRNSKSGVTYFHIGDNWYSAKSLAWKINKEGDKTYREGGRQVYSDDLQKFIEDLKEALKKNYVTSFKSDIKKLFQ